MLPRPKERRKGTRKRVNSKKKKAATTTNKSSETTETGTIDMYLSPHGRESKQDKTSTDSSPLIGKSEGVSGETKSKEKEKSRDSSGAEKSD